MFNRLFVLLFFLMLYQPIVLIQAQQDCGLVDAIDFPINREEFVLAQGYAVASSRHQGRFHTGEDWYGGRGTSLGQPVRSVARGRVVYSYDLGWGRDGGVVIIEHLFADGSLYYTQYGHMQNTDTYPFPRRLSCVAQGEIIGAVGDARPAPHLHFEVREANGINGSDPGSGYTLAHPNDEDYQNPGKFIQNQRLWLHPSHRFHIGVGSGRLPDERGPLAPPLILLDHSLLYLDGNGKTLRRATADGRILWRIRLDTPAVAITAWRGSSLLTFQNGAMSIVDVESGSLGETWQVEAQFSGPPLSIGDTLIFPTENHMLTAIAGNRREVIWNVPDIPPYRQAYISSTGWMSLITQEDEFLYLNPDGMVIERSQLRESGSMVFLPDASLLAYTYGGLWQVDSSGVWSLYIEDTPRGGVGSALLAEPGRLYLYSNQQLSAYDYEKNLLWRSHIPYMTGVTRMAAYDDLLLLTSNAGNIALVTKDGAFCNQVQGWGHHDAKQWHHLGDDGILRVAIADQIIGLDWEILRRPCRV